MCNVEQYAMNFVMGIAPPKANHGLWLVSALHMYIR